MSHNMFNTSQKVSLGYAGQQLWFEVWRYNTPTELHAALANAGIKDFDAKTVAYTQAIKEGPKCGIMYLLDSSIETMATEAAKLAFSIAYHRRPANSDITLSETEADHAAMVGFITSALYSRSKHY